jgi:heme-degrading monooxygenase HmoA
MTKAQHVVLFNFPEPLSEEEERFMFDAVRAWPEEIPGFTGLRIGKDVGGRNQGYEYLLLTEFDSEEAHQAYYAHPTHVRFAQWIGEHNAQVIRNDYALDENNLVL